MDNHKLAEGIDLAWRSLMLLMDLAAMQIDCTGIKNDTDSESVSLMLARLDPEKYDVAE